LDLITKTNNVLKIADIHRGIGNVGGMDREVLGGNADVRIVGWKAKGSRKGDETILMVGGGN